MGYVCVQTGGGNSWFHKAGGAPHLRTLTLNFTLNSVQLVEYLHRPLPILPNKLKYFIPHYFISGPFHDASGISAFGFMPVHTFSRNQSTPK